MLFVILPFLLLYLLPALGIHLPFSTVLAIIIYPLVIFTFLLYLPVRYSDSDVLDRVTIPNASEEMDKMLKTTTRGTNRLVNVEIISVLGRKKSLIQSELVGLVIERGVKLTPTQIIKYLSELDKMSVIHSEKAYKRKYSLTKKGQWCYEAIGKTFPKRQFWFIIRHYLGIRDLPEFPVSNIGEEE